MRRFSALRRFKVPWPHRDIWAVPPGDDGTIRRQIRRKRWKTLVAYGVTLSIVIGTATYAWMNQSTPVSADDALARFRSEGSEKAVAAGGSPNEDRRQGAERTKPRASTRPGRKEREAPRVAVGAAAKSPEETGGTVADPDAGPPDKTTTSAEAAKVSLRRPEEGVYEWSVDGYERAPGMRRDLPERSYRLINHAGRAGWVEHHIFSKQKEMWNHLTISEEGVFAISTRNRVEIGPVTADRTVHFNPPMLVNRFPNKLGSSWKGSWSGKTSGSYTARVFDHTTITIEGEEVEVWAVEVALEMHGEVEGTALVRSWVAPDYSLVVRQYQKTSARSGPTTYYSEWTGQVVSLTPRR
jgi:hypothetical protein